MTGVEYDTPVILACAVGLCAPKPKESVCLNLYMRPVSSAD
jgi:hypothetical protein